MIDPVSISFFINRFVRVMADFCETLLYKWLASISIGKAPYLFNAIKIWSCKKYSIFHIWSFNWLMILSIVINQATAVMRAIAISKPDKIRDSLMIQYFKF
jgi:hypothetical protein